MDVNNTYYHVLLGVNDWLQRSAHHWNVAHENEASAVAWDENHGGVVLRPEVYRFQHSDGLHIDGRLGAAMDKYGNLYTVEKDTLHASDEETFYISVHDRHTDSIRRFWPDERGDKGTGSGADEAMDAGFRSSNTGAQKNTVQLRSLAITDDHYLVAGMTEPPGLLVFDLQSGGQPLFIPWPATSGFYPMDIEARPGGGVWVLDANTNRANPELALCWAFDQFFRLDTAATGYTTRSVEVFRPAGSIDDNKKQHILNEPLEEMALRLASGHPKAITALPDDSLLVMEVDDADAVTRITRYAFGAQAGDAIDIGKIVNRQKILELADEEKDNALVNIVSGADQKKEFWQGYDLAFMPNRAVKSRDIEGTLYVVGKDGNQAIAIQILIRAGQLHHELRGKYLPMQHFGQKGLIVAKDQVFYDVRGRSIPLVEQYRPRYCKAATLELAVLDGKIFDCIWHRLLIDASIPAGTSVLVESRAANDERVLAKKPWQREPVLYLRSNGSELPQYNSYAEEALVHENAGTWELLFQQAKGRFIQLRLTLTGSGNNSPRLHVLRAYYPRFSYLKEYLPAIYQDDETSASFLDRYLANVEGSFTDLEGKIAEVQHLFDERSVDPAFLDWLASWFGILLDPSFDIARRRLFLRHAIDMFRHRGTLEGLIRSLRLALDPAVDDSLFEIGGVDNELAQIGLATTADKIAGYGIRVIESFRSRNQTPISLGDLTFDAESTAKELAEYASSPAFLQTYRVFLLHRYGQVENLAEVYDEKFESYLDVPLPAPDEDNTTRKKDWLDFVALVFPLTKHAHRFSVMIPAFLGEDTHEIEKRVAAVRQIVMREKPAHTIFEVKPYLALFQVGQVRLGLDTILGPGSRYVALASRGVLGATYLTSRYPGKTVGRMVTGEN